VSLLNPVYKSAPALRKILLTNDDGVGKYGLWVLYEEIKSLGDVTVVAPESARSSTGMSLTFHKALRIKKIMIRGKVAYAVSGNPADCISLGIYRILNGRKPDLVVSGINEGDNISIQAVYSSGTVAAAVHAAIMGIPSIAFSLHIPENNWEERREIKLRMVKAAEVAGRITKWLMEKGLPEGVDYINVNFPYEIDRKTDIEITTLSKARYNDFIIERRDPRGKPYYWQWGKLKPVTEFKPGTDAYALFVEKKISISPMSLDTSVKASENLLEEIRRFIKS